MSLARDTDPSLSPLFEEALGSADADRAAVIDEARTISYGRLNDISGALADKLAGSSGVVAIALPRGADAIISMVGAIRAGRPFLPVPARAHGQAETVMRAGVTTVVTHDVSAWHGYGITALGGAARAGAGRAGPVAHPGGLGYLLTTSGTSGPPKLIRGSARGLARYLNWQREELQLGPSDVLSNSAGPWFDFSFKETLAAIVAGSTVAVIPAAGLIDGGALLRWLRDIRPTSVCLLPSRLTSLVAAMERAQAPTVTLALSRLRWLLVSGEPFPARLLRRWRDLAPASVVLNLYGPAESTVIKFRHVLPPGARVTTRTVPVGTPIPGTRAELLVPGGSVPVRDGIGELCIVSDDLALGYVRPCAGSTSFDRDGAGRPRLRTGDLARRTSDGLFEFVGRADHVVKRRGVKVSMPAIEAAALELAEVHAAAAVASERDGTTVVVLFCSVCPASGPVPLRRIRAGLLDRIDHSMMPDLIRLLPQLPLDQRGKIDRSALRAMVPVSEGNRA